MFLKDFIELANHRELANIDFEMDDRGLWAKGPAATVGGKAMFFSDSIDADDHVQVQKWINLTFDDTFGRLIPDVSYTFMINDGDYYYLKPDGHTDGDGPALNPDLAKAAMMLLDDWAEGLHYSFAYYINKVKNGKLAPHGFEYDPDAEHCFEYDQSAKNSPSNMEAHQPD